MVRSNVHIPLIVTGVDRPNDTCMSVVFKRPADFIYEPGDWIDVHFYDGTPRGGITYSLSSSPTEDMLVITFRVGISPFKRQLQTVRPGDKMYISRYGNDYDFHLKAHRSSLLIAGGIGIAPFRSMLKAMHDTGSKDTVQLLYLNKGPSYLFAEELNAWRHHLQLDIYYIDTSLLSRKKREQLLRGLVNNAASYYFIAGPAGMVEATEHLLIKQGINAKDIRIDSFGGY